MSVSPRYLPEKGVNTVVANTVVPITAVIIAAATKRGTHLLFCLGLVLMDLITFAVTLSMLKATGSISIFSFSIKLSSKRLISSLNVVFIS